LFANKIIIDSMNYDLASDGPIPPLDSGLVTSSELVAMHFSASSVIKAFNTLPAALLAGMATPERLIPDRQAIFIAGDDLRAKSIVAGLAEDCGYAPVDTGSLKEGGQLQIPGGPLFGRAMTGRMAEKHKSDGWLTL
jgi:predicted dinucleotide-binding enzyme